MCNMLLPFQKRLDARRFLGTLWKKTPQTSFQKVDCQLNSRHSLIGYYWWKSYPTKYSAYCEESQHESPCKAHQNLQLIHSQQYMGSRSTTRHSQWQTWGTAVWISINTFLFWAFFISPLSVVQWARPATEALRATAKNTTIRYPWFFSCY